ncbi:MAG TPA: hypothetical protein VHW03_03685, partial [Chthoniobacterales bacterium]|nr:hypothetical protein [Chthoniobacterales bacterium]
MDLTMLEHDDLRWVAGNLSELNRLLQLASSHASQAQQQKNGECLELLAEEVEQASKTTQALFDRITSRVLSAASHGAKPTARMPNITVLPSP